MEEEIRVLEEASRIRVRWKARAEAIRVKREWQVEAERRATNEEAAQMEVERRFATMKHPLEFSLRLCTIGFRLLSDSFQTVV